LNHPIKQASVDNCCHIFCQECIILWSKVSNTCPICKARFLEIITQDNHKLSVIPKNLTIPMDDDKFIEEQNTETESRDDLVDIVNIPQNLTKEMGGGRCKLCGRLFKTKERFHKHLEVHIRIRNYECDICKAKFIKPSDLIKHQPTHTKEKRFTCDYEGCGIKFVNIGNLNRHIKCKHEKRKDYQCSTCNKKFSQSGDLFRHEKLHRGERDHMCDCCKETFIQRTGLLTHLKKHTKCLSYQREMETALVL